MTAIRIVSPTELVIEDLPEKGIARLQVERALKYRDLKAVFAFKRFKNSTWMQEQMGEDAYLQEYHRLKESQDGSALFPGDRSMSGLAHRISSLISAPIYNEVDYPATKTTAWYESPKNKPREYQIQAKDLLLEAKHGAVELATGLGKSTIILQLAREVGLPTVVMCPSKSIAKQLFADFLFAFGKAKVGFYGDSKKDCSKLFTIAISQSLVRVEKDSPDWDRFQQKQVFIADESHLTPAKTLQAVCFGLLAQCPYRFFFSATQMRSDGLGVVLEGITGKIVMRMPAREGIEAGWLARPNFRMISVEEPDTSYTSRDVLRLHRYYMVGSDVIPRIAGKLANMSVDLLKTPTLILIDEMPQFSKLLPYLRHEVGFAHGGVSAGKKDSQIPDKYLKPNNDALVKAFNARELPILVGTSAVAVGTDFTTVGHVIYMMGGSAETPVRQAIGRGTRRPDGKKSFTFTDFDIVNVPELHRQADARREVYADVWQPAEEIRGLK